MGRPSASLATGTEVRSFGSPDRSSGTGRSCENFEGAGAATRSRDRRIYFRIVVCAPAARELVGFIWSAAREGQVARSTTNDCPFALEQSQDRGRGIPRRRIVAGVPRQSSGVPEIVAPLFVPAIAEAPPGKQERRVRRMAHRRRSNLRSTSPRPTAATKGRSFEAQ